MDLICFFLGCNGTVLIFCLVCRKKRMGWSICQPSVFLFSFLTLQVGSSSSSPLPRGRLARRLNSSRPRPIYSLRSPRRNPERRTLSVEHHLGPTCSGAASALCSPGVPARRLRRGRHTAPQVGPPSGLQPPTGPRSKNVITHPIRL
jgi:hypothetical protein